MAVNGQPLWPAQSRIAPRTVLENTISDDEPKSCRNYVWGRCTKNTKCKFRHELDIEEMKKIIKFCHDYQNKSGCKRADCTYLHVTKEEEISFLNMGIIPSVLLERYAAIKIAESATNRETIPTSIFTRGSYVPSQQNDVASSVATVPVPVSLGMLTPRPAPSAPSPSVWLPPHPSPTPATPSVRMTLHQSPPRPSPSVLSPPPPPPQSQSVHMMQVIPHSVMPLGMTLAVQQQPPPPPPPPPPPTAYMSEPQSAAPVYTAPLPPHPESGTTMVYMNQQPSPMVVYDLSMPPPPLPTQIQASNSNTLQMQASSVAMKHKALSNLYEVGPCKIRKPGDNNAADAQCERCADLTIRIGLYTQEFEKIKTEYENLKTIYDKGVAEYETTKVFLRYFVSSDVYRHLEESFEGHPVPPPQPEFRNVLSVLKPASFSLGPSTISTSELLHKMSSFFRRTNETVNQSQNAADSAVLHAFLDLCRRSIM